MAVAKLSSFVAILVAGSAETHRVELAQLTIHQRIIVRVPQVPPAKAGTEKRTAPQTKWVEKKAPKCIPMGEMAGALITRPDSVDLVMAGGKRLRAHLEDDCPALDFYSGFYLKPTRDGKICEDRDSVRSRSGGQCRIDKFKTLVPHR